MESHIMAILVLPSSETETSDASCYTFFYENEGEIEANLHIGEFKDSDSK